MNWIDTKTKEKKESINISKNYKKYIKKYIRTFHNQWLLIKENKKKKLFKMKKYFYTNHMLYH